MTDHTTSPATVHDQALTAIYRAHNDTTGDGLVIYGPAIGHPGGMYTVARVFGGEFNPPTVWLLRAEALAPFIGGAIDAMRRHLDHGSQLRVCLNRAPAPLHGALPA